MFCFVSTATFDNAHFMLLFNLQPNLENDKVRIRPLQESDFDSLFSLASDPLVWAQHPVPDRYKREVFENYFRGGIESKGAVLVMDVATNQVIGTSRLYEYNPEDNSIVMGYTFFGREFWGGKYNPALKQLMLDYVFGFVDKVYFHIGAVNIRSQTAITRLGARKVGEADIAYHGEKSNANYIYVITKSDWLGK